MNIEKLKLAISIMERVPEERVNLKRWQFAEIVSDGADVSGTSCVSNGKGVSFAKYVQHESQATCGTLACAAGWLCISDAMQKEGLTADKYGVPTVVKELDNGSIAYRGFEALSVFFETDLYTVVNLFRDRTLQELQLYSIMSDKEVWLTRARSRLAMLEGGE